MEELSALGSQLSGAARKRRPCCFGLAESGELTAESFDAI